MDAASIERTTRLGLKLAAVASVLVLLALSYHFGVLHYRFSESRGLANTLVATGRLGLLMFIVSYAVLQTVRCPGHAVRRGRTLDLALAGRVCAVDDRHHGRKRDRLFVRALRGA